MAYAEAIERARRAIFPDIQLKSEQRDIIESVAMGRDTFGSLPVGFGKSVTYQLLPSKTLIIYWFVYGFMFTLSSPIFQLYIGSL